MAKMMGMLVVGLVMFAAAAGGSWFMQTKLHPPKAAVTVEDAEVAQEDALAQGTASLPPLQELAATLHDDVVPATASSGKERLPVAVRPREMSPEELLRYGRGVTEREQLVRREEELLAERRVQQKLALADIEGERREVDGLRVQIADQLKHAEQLILSLNEVRDALQKDKAAADEHLQKVKEESVKVDDKLADNTKRLSQWIQGMEAEKAADVLKEMAKDGKMDTAVQILQNFEQREAAKILSSLNDPKLVNEFVDKFRNLERIDQAQK